MSIGSEFANFAIGHPYPPGKQGRVYIFTLRPSPQRVYIGAPLLGGNGSGGCERRCDGTEIEIARPGTVWRLCGGLCDEPPPCQGQQPQPAGRAGCATT